MSTSGLSTSVTPPASLRVSTSGSASAPGRRGPMIHAPSTTAAPASDGRRQRRSSSGWRGRPSDVRGGWAKRVRSRAAARKPAAMRASVSTDAVAVGAERGDEHEQHGTRHEGLAAGAGVEGERVGGEHGERRCRSPPAATSRRRTRPARRRRWNWSRTSAEVGPRDVPRLARREDGGERVGVGRPRRPPTPAASAVSSDGREPGTWRRRSSSDDAVADDDHDGDVGDELPVGEHAGEAEGGDERVGGEGERGERGRAPRGGPSATTPGVRSAPSSRQPWRSPSRRHLGEDRVGLRAGRARPPARVLPASDGPRALQERRPRCGRRRRAAGCGGGGPSCRRRSASAPDPSVEHRPTTSPTGRRRSTRRARGPRWDRARPAPSAASLIAMRASRCSVCGGDVGTAQVGAVGRDEPGRQPGPVGAVHDAGGRRDGPLERLLAVRAARHVLVEQHDAALQALDAVLADLERSRSGPTPASGSCAARRRRRSRAGCGSRRVRGAGRAPAGGGRGRPGRAAACRARWARGETRTSSTPATSVVERASPRTSWRYGDQRADRSARRAARSGCGSRR